MTSPASPVGQARAGGGWRRAASSLALALAFPVAVLLLWSAASHGGWVLRAILPTPGDVAETLAQLWRSGELAEHVRVSGWRVVQGFAFGSLAGVVLGLATGLSRLADDLLGPTLRAFFQVPTMAWIPLLILLMGTGEGMKLLVIAKAVAVPVCLSTFEGVRSLSNHHMEVAQVLRLRPWTRWRRLVLPATFPSLVGGLRLGLTAALISLVGVELVSSLAGLGYLLNRGRLVFQIDVVFVSILVIGLIGLTLDTVMRKLDARVGAWRRGGP